MPPDFPPQLTISKIGTIKFGSDPLAPLDLDPIQACIWAEVNRLQWEFVGTSIWLVGETIHIWRNQTTYQFHWSDSDAIRAILNDH